MYKNLSPPQKFKYVLLFPFNLLSSIISLIFCIPGLGRILHWIWVSLITLVHFLFGLIEFGLWHLGFRPQKKFKIGVIPLKDQEGIPLESIEQIMEALSRTIDIYSQANVSILPALPAPKRGSEASGSPSHHSAFVQIPSSASPSKMLKVDCNLTALIQDLGLPGMHFQISGLRSFFYNSFRKISGYGAPVIIFVVEEMPHFGGCSLGWITDYVTIPKGHLGCIPHELGHACNLLHRDDPENLLYPKSCKPTKLTIWQIAMLRASRHVTFF